MLLVISDAGSGSESETIAEMFESGLMVFHLRKPGMRKEDYELILKKIPAGYKKRVVLHQHHELALRYNVKGLHMSEEQRLKTEPEALKKMSEDLKKKGLTFSSSFHSQEEIGKVDGIFDYVFLSPVFESISKEGYKPKSELRISIPLKKTKVIGLGGITAGNLQEVKARGFDGAAVLGSIWKKQEHAAEVFRQTYQAYQSQFLNSKIH